MREVRVNAMIRRDYQIIGQRYNSYNLRNIPNSISITENTASRFKKGIKCMSAVELYSGHVLSFRITIVEAGIAPSEQTGHSRY